MKNIKSINKPIFIAPHIAFREESQEYSEIFERFDIVGSDYDNSSGLETIYLMPKNYDKTRDYDFNNMSRKQKARNMYNSGMIFLQRDIMGNCCISPTKDEMINYWNAKNGVLFNFRDKDLYDIFQRYLHDEEMKLCELPIILFTSKYSEVRDSIINQELSTVMYENVNRDPDEIIEKIDLLKGLLDEILIRADDFEKSHNSSKDISVNESQPAK